MKTTQNPTTSTFLGWMAILFHTVDINMSILTDKLQDITHQLTRAGSTKQVTTLTEFKSMVVNSSMWLYIYAADRPGHLHSCHPHPFLVAALPRTPISRELHAAVSKTQHFNMTVDSCTTGARRLTVTRVLSFHLPQYMQ